MLKTTKKNYYSRLRAFQRSGTLNSGLQTLGSSTRNSGFGLVAVNPDFETQIKLALSLSHFFLLHRKSPLCERELGVMYLQIADIAEPHS
jgi:hypothetical protein